MTTEQRELFEKDPVIKLMFEHNLRNVELVGGAVVDILESKTPKDYDFISIAEGEVLKMGFKYSHDTKTASTFIKGDLIIQRLKTVISDFDFKISESSIRLNYSKELELKLSEISFESKILIPCDKCWTEKKNALNSLRRITHWREKGYKISDITYLSLLSVVGKNNNINS